jgi:phosphoribosylformylglycinamidine synthase
MNGELEADVPAYDLVLGGGAPVYKREFKEPAYYREGQNFNIEQIAPAENLKEVAMAMISNPSIASKRWIYEQYDSMVGTKNLSTNKPADAGIVHVKGTRKALALTVDCNSRYVHADPRKGASIAVAEAARNIICSGGKPLAITNCLNFGNPYNPEVYWQFKEAITGMGEACTMFNTPVTGGNVSFYNQTVQENATIPVFPTPTIGMLGLVADIDTCMGMGFQKEGDKIYLLGTSLDDINSSEYLYSWHKVSLSPAPHLNLEEELYLHKTLAGLIEHELIRSAHDISDGGLFVALAESGFVNSLGFDISSDETVRKDAFLFGEAQSRVIVSVSPEIEDDFIEFLALTEQDFQLLGEVTAGSISIDNEDFGNIQTFYHAYETCLPNLMNG